MHIRLGFPCQEHSSVLSACAIRREHSSELTVSRIYVSAIRLGDIRLSDIRLGDIRLKSIRLKSSICAIRHGLPSQVKSIQVKKLFTPSKKNVSATHKEESVRKLKTNTLKKKKKKKYAATHSIAHITIFNKHKHNHHYSHPIPSGLRAIRLLRLSRPSVSETSV